MTSQRGALAGDRNEAGNASILSELLLFWTFVVAKPSQSPRPS
jgi:hypothetical protein